MQQDITTICLRAETLEVAERLHLRQRRALDALSVQCGTLSDFLNAALARGMIIIAPLIADIEHAIGAEHPLPDDDKEIIRRAIAEQMRQLSDLLDALGGRREKASAAVARAAAQHLEQTSIQRLDGQNKTM